MKISFNEIEMTILKAARGAGMEWGLAEEAAQAARWLAGFDLPWADPLLGLFQTANWHSLMIGDEQCLRPVSPRDWLCPITVGAYLSDLGEKAPQAIERVRRPILLLPFAARGRRSAELAWEGARFRLEAGGAACSCEADGTIDPACAEWITLEHRTDGPGHKMPLLRGGSPTVDDAAWEALKRFEFRTYVPASLRSRLEGAGPALEDND
jgi:Protein of unknown function (DUF3726)